MANLTSVAGDLYSNGDKVSVTDTGTVLTGAALTAVNILGTNPAATLWGDGSITGSSDYGTFTKWANGNLEIDKTSTTLLTTTTGYSPLFYADSAAINFPMAFIIAPTDITRSAIWNVGICWGTPTNLTESTTTTCVVRIIGTKTGDKAYPRIQVKGRWK